MTKIQNCLSGFLIFWLVIEGFAVSLPKEITRCKLSDPLLDACITKAAQKFLPIFVKGLPEIGIPNLEPLLVPDIHNDDPVLNFKFTNNTVFWSTTAKIEEMKIDQIKKKITLIYITSGYMDSHYTAEGRLLVFPVVGDGESKMSLTGVRYVYKMYYDVVKGVDGKDYWKLLKHKVSSIPTKASFQFTNLFNGNKQLSDTILNFANENWKEIFNLVGKRPMKAITDTTYGLISTFFSKVPVDELFDP